MTHISGEANDTIEAMLIAEAMRVEGTRQRHNRESTARAGSTQGVSRESVRRVKKISKIAPELLAMVSAGTISLDAAYRQATDDRRVALYLKLSADTDDHLRRAADDRNMSRVQLVAYLIDEFLDADRAERNGWVL